MHNERIDGSVDDSIDIVLFPAGGRRVGCEACHVRSLNAAMEGDADVPSVESLLGFPPRPEPEPMRQCLVLRQDGGEHIVAIAGAVELARIPIDRIYPPPPLLAARMQLHGLRALVVDESRQHEPVIPIFEIRRPA